MKKKKKAKKIQLDEDGEASELAAPTATGEHPAEEASEEKELTFDKKKKKKPKTKEIKLSDDEREKEEVWNVLIVNAHFIKGGSRRYCRRHWLYEYPGCEASREMDRLQL